MDFKQPPFNDVRVRRALALASRSRRLGEHNLGGDLDAVGCLHPTRRERDQRLCAARRDDHGSRAGEAVALGCRLQGRERLAADHVLRTVGGYRTTRRPAGKNLLRLHRIGHRDDDHAGYLQDARPDRESLQADNGGRQFDVIWWWNVTETPHLLLGCLPVRLVRT